MQRDIIHLHTGLKSDRRVALFAGTFMGIFLLTSCAGLSSDLDASDPDTSTRIPIDQSAADSNQIAEDSRGPTILLGYSQETFKQNPIASFMYFVPLVAPTLVDNISSIHNQQQVGIVSYNKKVTSKSFHVICEFEISGTGFHENTFDPAGMIAAHTDELKKGQALTHMLDYIKFEGNGFGIIEIKGEINGPVKTVTEVDMRFNARGRKSPVTIGLYDVKPNEGVYRYENRSNKVFARVNTLAFKKAQGTPRMGIKVASISKSEESEGFWSHVKGTVANLLISPPRVDKLGNNTMLEFGDALLKQKPEFTFPKAKNIKESKVVEIDPLQQ